MSLISYTLHHLKFQVCWGRLIRAVWCWFQRAGLFTVSCSSNLRELSKATCLLVTRPLRWREGEHRNHFPACPASPGLPTVRAVAAAPSRALDRHQQKVRCARAANRCGTRCRPSRGGARWPSPPLVLPGPGVRDAVGFAAVVRHVRPFSDRR